MLLGSRAKPRVAVLRPLEVRDRRWTFSAAGSENFHQFLRRDDFQLRVGAVFGLLVDAPSAELGHVAKAAALHVFVSHLNHQLGTKGLPREIFALAPAALTAGHALLSRGQALAQPPQG